MIFSLIGGTVELNPTSNRTMYKNIPIWDQKICKWNQIICKKRINSDHVFLFS